MRFSEDVEAGAIGYTKVDALTVLRRNIEQLSQLCWVIADKYDGSTDRDISIRLALQYLRKDLGRSDAQLSRLERGTK